MMEVRLFDVGPELERTEIVAGDSADVRRTKRRRALLAAGVHPTTRRPLAGNGETCKTCEYLVRKVRNKTYWKCSAVALTGGPGSDVRLSWPACDRYAWNPNAWQWFTTADDSSVGVSVADIVGEAGR